MRLALSGQENAESQLLFTLNQNYDWKKNLPHDRAWARLVYALGLTRGKKANQVLMDMWSVYDHAMANGKMGENVNQLAISGGVPPLRVIADALHFSLDKQAVRDLFTQNINLEITSRKYLSAYRKSIRRKLRFILLRWDLLESVDGPPHITPQRVTVDYLITPNSPKNTEIATRRLWDKIKKLPKIPDPVNEKKWKHLRSGNDDIYILFVVGRNLHQSVATELYDNYLSKKVKGDRSSLYWGWMVALQACRESCLRSNDRHTLDGIGVKGINHFFAGAAGFLKSWRDDYSGDMLAKLLFTVKLQLGSGILSEKVDSYLDDVVRKRLSTKEILAIKKYFEYFFKSRSGSESPQEKGSGVPCRNPLSYRLS